MIPCAVIQAAIGGADQIHADPQYGCEGRHRIEAAVEPEYKLIEVGRQMLLADPGECQDSCRLIQSAKGSLFRVFDVSKLIDRLGTAVVVEACSGLWHLRLNRGRVAAGCPYGRAAPSLRGTPQQRQVNCAPVSGMLIIMPPAALGWQC